LDAGTVIAIIIIHSLYFNFNVNYSSFYFILFSECIIKHILI
jgi:hypothetical protein